MKLIKISPKFQITIPKLYRNLCRTGWFSLIEKNRVITLRPVEIKEAETDQEIMEKLLKECGENS
ncbi:hypothetical protein GF366_00150 [Candidatus Peregrinibacteria bacterium]|nr:hypothetical protein [Candidatus Peregrinibacteria bacterium]